MSKFLCIIIVSYSVPTFVWIIIEYECIANVCYVNPANDSNWYLFFSYCHGPGYNHHLYVRILWNVISKDEQIKISGKYILIGTIEVKVFRESLQFCALVRFQYHTCILVFKLKYIALYFKIR